MGCRLCLCQTTARNYFSLEGAGVFATLQTALGLTEDFSRLDLQPNHMCDHCQAVIDQFNQLKQLAGVNEAFLIRHQDKVQELGLAAARELYRASGEGAREEGITSENNQSDTKVELPEGDGEDVVHEQDYDLPDGLFAADDDEDEVKQECTDTEDAEDKILVKGNVSKSKQKHKKEYVRQKVACDQCGLQVYSNALSRHHSTHEEASWRCSYPDCAKVFKAKITLRRHISAVHLKEATICNNCGKEVMRSHITLHLQGCNPANINDVTCEICNNSFKNVDVKRLHIQVVHNTPVKGCDKCGKQVKNLESHMRQIHSDSPIRRVPCSQCDKTFATKQSMRKHTEMVHDDKKEQCSDCGQWFKNLYDHVKKVHKVVGR
jgi:hypothetical protein